MPFGGADPNSATQAEVKAKAQLAFLPKNFTDDEDVLVRAQHVHQSARGFKHVVNQDASAEPGQSGSGRNDSGRSHSTLGRTEPFERARSSSSWPWDGWYERLWAHFFCCGKRSSGRTFL